MSISCCPKCKKPTYDGKLCENCKKKIEKEKYLNITPKQIASNFTLKNSTNYKNYFVFQGKTFVEEQKNQCLWAPIQNKDGRSFHHWTRLTELKVGDRVFHCNNGNIMAISTVVEEAKITNNPPFPTEGLWQNTGWIVKCEYTNFYTPLPLKLFRQKIQSTQRYQYSPFDKNGSGVLGYLFPLSDELASMFEEEIKKLNLSK